MRRWMSGMLMLACVFPGSAMAEEAGTQPSESPNQTQPAEDAFDRFPLIRCEKATGYRGIWYAEQPLPAPASFKYSGGLGTYSTHHVPMAYYAAEAEKTFFVYGGTGPDGGKPGHANELWIMASYYDHKTGMVPRPRVLLKKKTDDARENPVIMLDDKGHVWIFVPTCEESGMASIYRSVKPYDIDTFQLIRETRFAYPQPWHIAGRGFLLLHTRFVDGQRRLYFTTSPDGVTWTEPTLLAAMGDGHDQISWRHRNKVGTAFTYHPPGGGSDARTNLYYIDTRDFGETWRTAGGTKIELPMRDVESPAIVREYEGMKRLVYLKDMDFTPQGRPVLLYVLSRGALPGPDMGRRTWYLARHFGNEWMVSGTLHSDHNYDTGALYLLGGPQLEIIAPIAAGPQPNDTGGEMTLLWSNDAGRTWRSGMLTRNSYLNHSYARRPVNVHPHFRALWADGHARQRTISRLYYCDSDGVTYRLPREMSEDFEKPAILPIGADVPLTLEDLGLDPEDLELDPDKLE